MYQGTYARNPRKPRRRRVRMNKTAILLLAVILLAGAVIGTTVAYLTTNTGSIVNTFKYAKVTCEVVEDFDNATKKNVKIQNTGDTAAYIRATYVINWVDESGNIFPGTPEGYSYEKNENPDGAWKYNNADGYFYYPTAVPVGGTTDAGSLLTCSWSHPAGETKYHLSVEIIATAIQSEPADAVKEAWGVTYPLNFN